jgi:streptogramin lyase
MAQVAPLRADRAVVERVRGRALGLIVALGVGLLGVLPMTSAAAAAAPFGTVRTVVRGLINEPRDLAKGSDGNVWFTNNRGDSIGSMTTAGVVTEHRASGIHWPSEIVADPHGPLWFVNDYEGTIGRMTTLGDVTIFADAAIRFPRSLDVGADGSVWFVSGFSSIARLSPSGDLTSFPIGTGYASDIAVGPNGTVWFTSTMDAIGRMTPDGQVTTFTDPGVRLPGQIVVGPDGTIWFGNGGSAPIGVIQPDGRVGYSSGYDLSGVGDLLVDGDHVWAVGGGSFGGPRIVDVSQPVGSTTTIALPGMTSQPRITAGPDERLWFAEPGHNSIGQVDQTGRVTRIPQGAVSVPVALSAARDGSVWFAGWDGGQNTIGRVAPDGTVSVRPIDENVNQSSSIAADDDGGVWFATFDRLGHLDAGGTITTSLPYPGASGLVLGPDGNAWSTDRFRGAVRRVTAEGAVTSFAVPGATSTGGITVGPDGDLWFTADGSFTLGRMTIDGDLVGTFTAAQGAVGSQLVTGSDGAVWLAAHEALTRVTPAGTIAHVDLPDMNPQHLTAGPDGDLWFVDWSTGDIRRAATNGAVSEPVTTAEGVFGMTAGPDGDLWFAEPNRSAILALSLGDAVRVPAAPPRPLVVGNDRRLDVTWTPPADDGGAPVTAYVATASPGGATCTWTGGAFGCSIAGVSNGRRAFVTVVAVNSAGRGAPSPPSLPTVPVAPSRFHPLPPTRVLDSRPAGPAVGPYRAPWAPGETRDVVVAGVGGVPATASAVALNVTVTNTSAPGFATLWPAGQARPLASSLNWVRGETVANAVTALVGTAGRLSVLSAGSAADVIVDVVGYYTSGDAGDGLTLISPVRIQDSRPGGPVAGRYATPWDGGTSRHISVRGIGGAPPDATAAVLNVTVTNTTDAGYLTVFPAGVDTPLASNLNWAAGETRPNLVTVPLGDDGEVAVFNAIGRADVIMDLVGWFSTATGAAFHPVIPARVQDSRPAGPTVGPYASPWTSGLSRPVRLAGAGGVPVNADGALLNVTVTNTTGVGFVTVSPSGATQPLASSLNWGPGQTVPNAVPAKIGSGGQVALAAAGGTADVIVDVNGWYG